MVAGGCAGPVMLNPDFDPESTAIIRAAQELIQAALRPNIDLDAFLTEVLNQTQRLVPFDVGWLLLREGDSVRIRATDQAHRADIGVVFPADDCISGLSMLRRAPIHVPDLARMPDDLRQVYKPSRVAEPVMRSELVVPMMIGDDAIGSLNIESRQPARFAPRRIELLRLLADHAALAIELARSRQEAAALGASACSWRARPRCGVVRTVLERGADADRGALRPTAVERGPEPGGAIHDQCAARDWACASTCRIASAGWPCRSVGP